MMQMISLMLLLVFVSGKNVCDICQCTRIIICSEENIISDFSDFQPANYKSVTDM